MAYTRKYKAVIPVDKDTDLDVMRWLMRESFEKKATGDSLVITDYTEAAVAPEDIPPKVADDLGKPAAAFLWFAFTATATVAPGLINA